MDLSPVAVEGRRVGISDKDVNVFTVKAAFSTLTNVDFDPDRFLKLIHQAAEKRNQLIEKVQAAGGNTDFPDGPVTFKPEATYRFLFMCIPLLNKTITSLIRNWVDLSTGDRVHLVN